MTEDAPADRDYGEPIRFALSDGELAARHWPRSGAPRLVFCHATGFCASAYRAMLARLAETFDVVALDMRGHGRSALPANPSTLTSWAPFARDLGGVLDQMAADGVGPFVLAGHSFGATSSLLAARDRRDVAALALIDPVVVSRWVGLAAATPMWPLIRDRISLVKGARTRRAAWPDRAAARAVYARKTLFARWAEGCLDDYLEDGLTERGDSVVLACAPAWEAAVFGAQANRLWPAAAAAAVTAPISILVAETPGSTVSLSGQARFRRLGAEIETAPGATHMVPFERPALAAEFVAAAARKTRA